MKTNAFLRLLILLALPAFAQAQAPTNLTGWLVYSRTNAQRGSVWATDLAGRNIKLIDSAQYPKVSANGRYLLYMHETSLRDVFAQGKMERLDMLTGRRTSLLPDTVFVVGYDMNSTDSSVFYSYSCDIYRQPFAAAGSFGTALSTGDCYDDGPAIRRTDGLLAFHNVVLGALFLYDVNAHTRTAIPHTISGDVWPTWSPDGQWLFFGRTNLATSSGTHIVHEIANLYKIRPDGSELTRLTPFSDTDSARFSAGGFWSLDGQTVYVAGKMRRNAGYTFYAVKTDGSLRMDTIPAVPGDSISWVNGLPPNHVFTAIALRHSVQPLRVWPNPAQGQVRVEVPAALGTAVAVTVYDAAGRPVQRVAGAQGTVTLSLKTLAPGLYAVRVVATKGIGAEVLRVE